MRAYASIDGNQRPQTSLHWHILAFFTPWMILGGFLILPHLFTQDPQLRTTPTALRVLATLSITAGFTSTVILSIVAPTWTFILQSVLLPALSASCLALLSFVFLFVISERYTWEWNAILSTAFAIAFFIYFSSASLYAHRKALREQPEWVRPVGPLPPLPTLSQLCSKVMRRERSTPGPGPIYPEAPVEIIRAPKDPNEEAQRRQMESLLQRGRINPAVSERANQQSTYHLDLPDDEEQEEIAEAGEARTMHSGHSRVAFTGSTSSPRTWVRPMINNIAETLSGGAATSGGSTTTSNLQAPPPISSARRGVTFHERSASREERRREIELSRWA